MTYQLIKYHLTVCDVYNSLFNYAFMLYFVNRVACFFCIIAHSKLTNSVIKANCALRKEKNLRLVVTRELSCDDRVLTGPNRMVPCKSFSFQSTVT